MEKLTCVVTGGTSGIGRTAAGILAREGHQVLLTGRNRLRGEALVAELKQARAAGAAEFLAADLSTMAGVRALAAEIRQRHARLDVLVNNAGLFTGKTRRLTADGFEETFAVNHLAPFLLTNLLREPLAAAGAAGGARVVTVSSEAHRSPPSLDFDNLQSERRYGAVQAYSRSKLANVLFTRELARRWAGDGITANCLHPGVVRTGIWDGPEGLLWVVGQCLKPFMISSEKGGSFVARLASSPDVAGVTGKYFNKDKEAEVSAGGRDDAAAARLWEVSAGLVGGL